MTIKKRKKNSIHLIYFKVKFGLDSWNAWYIYEIHSWGTRLSLINPAHHSGLGYKGTILGVQGFPLVIQLPIVVWGTRVQQGYNKCTTRVQQGYKWFGVQFLGYKAFP